MAGVPAQELPSESTDAVATAGRKLTFGISQLKTIDQCYPPHKITVSKLAAKVAKLVQRFIEVPVECSERWDGG